MRFTPWTIFGWLFLAVFLSSADMVMAAYNRTPESALDPGIFRIDEKKFLGTMLDGELGITGHDGSRYRLKDFLGKPMVLLLSYYRCDGVCSTLNQSLKSILESLKRVAPGEDFNILTLSFDTADDAASAAGFRAELGLSGNIEKAWVHAVMREPVAMEKFTAGLGYKFFWSPRDRTFFHPNVFMIVSPEGRVTRFLQSVAVGAGDLELAILEARLEETRITEIADFAVSLCYSYNYKEGKYTLNLPLFVAIGSLTVGMTSLLVSVLIFRRRKLKEEGP